MYLVVERILTEKLTHDRLTILFSFLISSEILLNSIKALSVKLKTKNMIKKQIILTTLLLVFINVISGSSQSDNVKVISNNKEENKYLEANKFYLTHYLYIDLFLRESLYVDANEEEVAFILNEIDKKASIDHPLDFEIQLADKNIYRIRIKIAKKDDEELFIAFTNFNPNTKKFEDEFGDESYTRWYFLNDDKMTYRKDMSGDNDYSTMSKIDLANAYLFDELSENDKDIESTLIEGKKESDDLQELLTADLILLKNYIYESNENESLKLVESIDKKIESNRFKAKLKGIESAFNATKFQIELMKLID